MSPGGVTGQVAAGVEQEAQGGDDGEASAGKLNMETISISPTRPPPGAPERTKADRMATTMAMP